MSIKEIELRDHFIEKFKAFKEKMNGGQTAAIKDLRTEAFDAFSSKGFPMSKDEEYKYTPLTKALLRTLEIESKQPSEAGVIPPFSEHLIPDLQGYILVYWNGKLVYRSEDFPETVIVSQMDELDHSQQQELGKYLAKQGKWKTDAFTALNTAFFNQGSVIRVTKGTQPDLPIIIYHLNNGDNGTVYTQTRHLVIAETDSQPTLVEINKNVTSGQKIFHNSVSEVYIEKGARLDYTKIQTECSDSFLVDNTFINQEKNSRLQCATITTSGSIIRNNLNITIDGEYCESYMNGLYLVKDKDHVDNHTMVDHRIANSYSNELYKGIIDDSATGVFNGKIFVQPNAQKTNAFQSNKNILLSDKASMNTKPQLEIWADDVKCSHGATTGQLDADQVFYLRARGLDEQQARGLLLYAFATELLEHISIPVLKGYLVKIIEDRLYNT